MEHVYALWQTRNVDVCMHGENQKERAREWAHIDGGWRRQRMPHVDFATAPSLSHSLWLTLTQSACFFSSNYDKFQLCCSGGIILGNTGTLRHVYGCVRTSGNAYCCCELVNVWPVIILLKKQNTARWAGIGACTRNKRLYVYTTENVQNKRAPLSSMLECWC